MLSKILKITAVILVAALLFSSLAACAGDGIINKNAPYTKKGSVKILSIANSYGDDSYKYLWNILNDTGLYDEIIIGHLYRGGCDVETHISYIDSGAKNYRYYYTENGVWTYKSNVSSNEAIAERDWDVITTQQSSVKTYSGEGLDRAAEFLGKVKAIATNPDVVFCWNMTWTYQNVGAEYGGSQTAMLSSAFENVKTKISPLKEISAVMPTGTAIQNVRTSFIGNTLNRDGTHLELGIGCYTAALTLAGAITGYDTDRIKWTPEDQPEVAKRLHVIKECVKNALEYPFEITNSSYTERDGFDFTKDEDILRAVGKNIDDYKKVAIDWKDKLRYEPKRAADAPVSSNYHFATQLFTKEDIPVGSVIIVDDLYALTPVKYKTTDRSEPDEDISIYKTNLSSKKIFYIDEAFWGEYNYVGFNISMYSDELTINYGSHGGVRIYKAK